MKNKDKERKGNRPSLISQGATKKKQKQEATHQVISITDPPPADQLHHSQDTCLDATCLAKKTSLQDHNPAKQEKRHPEKPPLRIAPEGGHQYADSIHRKQREDAVGNAEKRPPIPPHLNFSLTHFITS